MIPCTRRRTRRRRARAAPRVATGGRPRAASRRGMGLVEVIVAFTIFAGALVALARYSWVFARSVTQTNSRAVASELAAERLETVKGGTNYETLDSLYAEPTAVTVATHPRYRRQTLFRRVGGRANDLTDYKVVTVVVSSTLLREPVRRTTVIGDF